MGIPPLLLPEEHLVPPAPVALMFRRTDPQLSLMESRFLVSPRKLELLERSWAEAFRRHVLPLIDEEAFRECFCENNGRPNKSIRLLVGMHLLKEADDLTVEQVLDAVEFNIQWQHALGVEPADAHVCERTFYYFRDKLAANERSQVVFEKLTCALMEADGLSSVRQRLDSTHVISNIKLLSRLGLFTETVTHFMRELRKEAPEKLARLDGGYARRYLDREGYFADAKREQAQRRMPLVAQDLGALVRAFEADPGVNEWQSYRLLVRLLSEQCDVAVVADGDVAVVTVKPPQDIGGDSLQSPHDPDATYGHKGKGYETQIAETCVEENPYQVITAVEVTSANASDQHATVPIVEDLVDRGIAPEVLLADTGYGSGENIVECAQMGVELLARVQDPAAPARVDVWEAPVEPMPSTPESAPAPKIIIDTSEPLPVSGLGAFAFNTTFDEVLRCPEGHPPVDHYATDSAFYTYFPGNACRECPVATTCPTRTRAGTDERMLRWRDSKAATAARQREQQEPAFKQAYKLRSGIESTNAEIKGRHGAGDLRVRGKTGVEVAMYMKAAALNAKRAVQHHTNVLRTTPNGPATTELDAK